VPNTSIGFRYKDIVFYLKGEFCRDGLSSKQEDHEMVVEMHLLMVVAWALYMEQRVHNDKVLVLALRTHMSNITSWLACLFDIHALLQYS